MSPETKRILVVRTDRLGDVILTLPMLPRLKKCIPDAHIAMLLSRYTGEIVERNPYIDELLWYDDGRAEVPFDAILRTVRGGRFGTVIVVHPTLRLAWLMYRAGIPVRIGSGYRYYSFLFNRKVYEHRKNAQRHEVEYNLNLLSALDCQGQEKPGVVDFGIVVSPGAEARVEHLLSSLGIDPSKRRLIVHPGSGGSAREWPMENLIRLASLLLEEKELCGLVTGNAGEFSLGDQFVRGTDGKTTNLAGRLTVTELAALIRTASLFVGHSTGPLHIAAAVGTPVLGFYPQLTPMSPRRWGPYAGRNIVLVPDKPVDCKDCVAQKGGRCACMETITVERAYDSARALLSGSTIRAEGAATHGV